MSFIVLLLAYLLGSIPFGLLLTRVAGLGDIRNIGSGNIGATNVMRTGHKGLGATTLLLDGGKGFTAVYLAQFLEPNYALLAGILAVLGHIFPVWLRFKGGKGLATALGTIFALNPVSGLAFCIIWLSVFAVARLSSLSGLSAIAGITLASLLGFLEVGTIYSMCLCILMFYTHRSNIARLKQGTERNFKKKAP